MWWEVIRDEAVLDDGVWLHEISENALKSSLLNSHLQ
jgi:hypothetical protein